MTKREDYIWTGRCYEYRDPAARKKASSYVPGQEYSYTKSVKPQAIPETAPEDVTAVENPPDPIIF